MSEPNEDFGRPPQLPEWEEWPMADERLNDLLAALEEPDGSGGGLFGKVIGDAGDVGADLYLALLELRIWRDSNPASSPKESA